MKILFILNDAPYGTERSYNALRLANALAETDQLSALCDAPPGDVCRLRCDPAAGSASPPDVIEAAKKIVAQCARRALALYGFSPSI